MWVADGWTDFELIDAGNGEKLERWGAYILRRPDPQALWPAGGDARWDEARAVYRRSKSGGGEWAFAGSVPPSWEIGYRRLRLTVKPMQFKHTGVFPEQSVNWDWVADRLARRDARDGSARVLNVFAYTGASTVAAALAGATVCHVDAAKGMVALARQNAALSRVPGDRIRYIVDDAMKFIKREIRRGVRYDAVIMDPPAYGRGPGGELWRAETHLYGMVELCAELLSDRPLFFILNAYAAGITAASAGNILTMAVSGRFGGRVENAEMGVRSSSCGVVLPCGCCARWEPD